MTVAIQLCEQPLRQTYIRETHGDTIFLLWQQRFLEKFQNIGATMYGVL